MSLNDFEFRENLGKGSFGEVYLTQRVGRNGYFATKKIDLTLMLDSENAKGLSNELNILKIINNPYLVKLEDLMRTSNHLYIVMEYCNGGDLRKCLTKRGWSAHSSKPACFKAGYPFFTSSYDHAMLAAKISGSKVYVYGHTNDRCGDIYVTSGIKYWC